MARYLEISNAAGKVVADDETMLIQVIAATKVAPLTNFTANTVTSQDGGKPIAAYSAGYYIDKYNGLDLKGHIAALKQGETNLIQAYRMVDVDLANPPYAYVSGTGWSDTRDFVNLVANTYDTTPCSAQVVWLKLDPYNVAMPDSSMLAFNANGDITFDIALGYVHHIATKRAKIAVTTIGDFSVQIADISGLGVDISRLFLRCRGVPRVSQWDGLGSFAYRVGYRSFVPRLRVTNGIVYVDFKRWVPYGYTGSIAQIYVPTYDISVYYIPAIRSF